MTADPTASPPQFPPIDDALRARLAADVHRPRYHFLPEANWLNDPNGLIQWQGLYHLFYQYNPHGAFHGTIHWGHAVSADLVHWEHLPIGLHPTPGGPDQDGCWSGCAVDDDGVATLIYTGVRGPDQLACVARSTDDRLIAWEKYVGNPVIAAPPPDLDLVAYRDHSVWREDGVWYQVIGAGIRGVGGTALLYRSPDLLQWEYMHPVLVGDIKATDPVWTGEMWECPDLFQLDDRHVLMVAAWNDHRLHYSAYMVGEFEDLRFKPQHGGITDPGDSFYAPQTMRDDQGRRLMWGWLREDWSGDHQREAGWSGAMSLPRELFIRPDGHLGQRPVPELQMLRGIQMSDTNIVLGDEPVRWIAVDEASEIIVEIELGDATYIDLDVRCSEDDEERTRITFDRAAQTLGVDRTRASLLHAPVMPLTVGPHPLAEGETLRLQIFLDHSVIEIFGNERTAHAVRVYPARRDSLDLVAHARGGHARIVQIDMWDLDSQPQRDSLAATRVE
jgi:beta-fructofuranosidase